MILLEFRFFLLLACSVPVYYLLGWKLPKLQKYVLLTTSLVFFVWSSGVTMLLQVAFIIAVTYLGARLIFKGGGKSLRLKRTAFIVSLCLLLADLVTLKYVYNLGTLVLNLLHRPGDISWMQFVAPIGISYFTLSAIGYLIDIYWESYLPEKNVIKIALLVAYFPCLVSGPVVRYSEMSSQFGEKHPLQYENIMYGIRRMAWGYFKKLVIADRLAIFVTAVFGDYQAYPGAMVLLAVFAYAFQLYADFSGCMDIILGASQLFGIKLPENFHAPFFSRSIEEFWRRWHITLGLWFKDYIMYPLQKTKPFQKLGKKCKKIFGKYVGKRIPTFLAMIVLWALIGLWHGGTAVWFWAAGIIPCIYLIGAELLSPAFQKVNRALHIRTECFSWRWFQRIRTFLLMCVPWLFICAGGVRSGFRVIRYIFTSFRMSSLSMSTMRSAGAGGLFLTITGVGLIAMFVWDYFREKGTSGTAFLDRQNLVFRWVVLWAEVLIIFFFAEVGQSAFIYFQF